jgi:hypothetical protein
MGTVAIAGAVLATAGCVTRPERVLSPAEIEFLQSVSAAGESAEESPLFSMKESDAMALLEQFCESEVSFFGRVEDTSGTPIEGARVSILVFDRPLDRLEYPFLTGPILPPVTSGADGTFRLRPRPGAAIIVDVSMEGYEPVLSARRLFYYSPDLVSHNQSPLPTEADPEVFVLGPIGDAAVQKFATGAMALPSDGSPVEVSLRRLTPYGVEPGQGDLRVTVTTGVPEPDGHYDWRVRVEVPGGELQEYKDFLMTTAPEDGYEPEFEFAIAADDPKWSHRAEHLLILHLEDGTYAAARLRVRTQGDRFFAVDGTWNKEGGRYVY